VALLVAAGALAALLAMAGVHALGLVGLYRQPAWQALRNALVLALRHPGSTAGVVVAGLAGLALAGLLGGAPLVILPAALVLVATRHTLSLVRIERGAASGPLRDPARTDEGAAVAHES
jgi:hypothetical protein